MFEKHPRFPARLHSKQPARRLQECQLEILNSDLRATKLVKQALFFRRFNLPPRSGGQVDQEPDWLEAVTVTDDLYNWSTLAEQPKEENDGNAKLRNAVRQFRGK